MIQHYSKSVITLLLTLCFTLPSYAQTLLNCDQSYDISALVSDYTIPTGISSLSFTIKGGDGGNAKLNGGTCNVNVRGGAGATVSGTFEVGTADNQLKPGGTLKVFVGRAGETESKGCAPIATGVYGGGAGSSAILYLPPGGDPNDVAWLVLAEAGGGGGGARPVAGVFRTGKGGIMDSFGGATGGNSGGTVLAPHVCPTSNNATGHGGQIICNTSDEENGETMENGALEINTNPSLGRIRLLPNSSASTRGGSKGNNPKGGNGFGGGGAGVGGGGGGGGFGGGAGSTSFSGGGGGSFVNTYYLGSGKTKTSGGDGLGNESDGSVTISTFPGGEVNCKANVQVQLDASGNGSFFIDDLDAGSIAPCYNTIQLWREIPGSFSNVPNPVSVTCFDIGQLFETYYLLIEDNGVFETCSSTVTVVDPFAPTALCKNATVLLNEQGMGTLTNSQVDNGSADNCGAPVVVLSKTSFSCSDVGTTTVTLTATDIGQQSASCTASVSVQEPAAPVARCNDVTVQLDTNGDASITTNDIDNGSADPCHPNLGSLALDKTIFDCSDVGNNTVILSATDVNGNTGTCSATVTVQDNTAPIASCQDVTVQLSGIGNGQFLVLAIGIGSTDNCMVQDATLNNTSFNCANVGNNNVVLTVTDMSGNSNTCSATITIQDNVPPVATCQDVTIQLNSLGQGTIAAEAVDNGSTDDCGISGFNLSRTNFDCAFVGDNNVILTATDVNGNSSTCSATVRVEDNIAPAANCQDVTIQLDANGDALLSAQAIDNGSTDACGISGLTVNQTTFNCSDVGTVNATLYVTDVNGNTGNCTATVEVQDITAPLANCQDVTVQLDASGNGTTSSQVIDNGSTDECVNLSLTLSQTTFNCADVGNNTVTLTAMDNRGNSSTCTATVTVQDNILPTAICQDVTVQLDANGDGSIMASTVDNGATDECGIAGIELSKTSFNCGDVGNNTVILTATDTNGNTSTCSATVTVQDNDVPAVNCQDVTIQLDANGNALLSAQAIDNGSTDACGVLDLNLSQTTFNCSDVGANNVALTITDQKGNSSTCSAIVTVQDNTAPLAKCQDVTVQLDANGNGTTSSQLVDNGSTDECGIPLIIGSITLSQTNFDCTDVGANTVILAVTDVNDNTGTCTATVTVQDHVAPTAICQDVTVQLDASGNGSISVTDVNNGSADICGISSYQFTDDSKENYTCSDLFSSIGVSLVVTDVNGNSSTCSANVTVEDNIPPTVTCQDVTINTDPGQCTGTLIIDPATDNCSITIFQHRYREVDAQGNDLNGMDWSAWTSTPTQALNPGHWKFEKQAVDVSNNLTKCSFIVTVIDEEPPLAICLNPTYTFNGEQSQTIEMSHIWDDLNTTDNCGLVDFVSQSVSEITCDQAGSQIPVTVTVVDDYGNTSTCTSTVTIEGFPCDWEIDLAGLGCDPGEGTFSQPDYFTLTAEGCYDPTHYRIQDQHGFIQRELCGDGEIIAQVTEVIGNGWAGISMRESNAPSARMIQLMIDGQYLTRRELRTTPNSPAFAHQFPTMGKNWLKLNRIGNQFNAYHSSDGVNWGTVFTIVLPLTNCLNIGLITMNGSPSGEVTGVFDHVSVSGSSNNALSALPDGIEAEAEVQVQVEPQLEIAPNPVSSYSTIRLFLPETGTTHLSILNLQGQVVRQLYQGQLNSGEHAWQWDGASQDGTSLPSGIYWLRLQVGKQLISKKIVVQRL